MEALNTKKYKIELSIYCFVGIVINLKRNGYFLS